MDQAASTGSPSQPSDLARGRRGGVTSKNAGTSIALHQQDLMHPSPKGSAAIASRVAAAIRANGG